jgi:hypothetical protein
MFEEAGSKKLASGIQLISLKFRAGQCLISKLADSSTQSVFPKL